MDSSTRITWALAACIALAQGTALADPAQAPPPPQAQGAPAKGEEADVVEQAEQLAAPAVQPLAPQPVLSLDQALGEADQHNLDLVQARERLAQAKILARKAWAGYLPQISGSGRYTYNNTEAVLPFPTGYNVRSTCPPGTPANLCQTVGPAFDPNEPRLGFPSQYYMVPAGFQDIVIQRHDMWNWTASANQALIVPALWPAIRSAYLAGDVAELSVRNARREILFATAQLYYGAEALREALGVQQRQLDTLRQHEKDAKVRYDVGTVPRVSYLRAQIETARAEQDYRRTQNAYLSAKSALAALLNREPDFDVARPPPTEAPKGDLRTFVDEAPTRRLDVEAAKKNVALARTSRLQVWAKYLPSIAAFAQVNNSNVTGFTGERTFWVAGAALSWTLLDGGLREAELAESSHKIAEAVAAARAADNKVKDEVRRAFYDLESAEANRTKAAEQVKLARENSQLVEASYNAGAATYLDVVDAQTALLGAELSSVSEGLNAELSALKLARAAGLFEPQPQAVPQTK